MKDEKHSVKKFFEFDKRCKETQKASLILGNPKKESDDKNGWHAPRVAPITSSRNKINPVTGRKFKFDEK